MIPATILIILYTIFYLSVFALHETIHYLVAIFSLLKITVYIPYPPKPHISISGPSTYRNLTSILYICIAPIPIGILYVSIALYLIGINVIISIAIAVFLALCGGQKDISIFIKYYRERNNRKITNFILI